jgi:hypothetical protein
MSLFLYVSTGVCLAITWQVSFHHIRSYRQISFKILKDYFLFTTTEYFSVVDNILNSDSGECMF